MGFLSPRQRAALAASTAAGPPLSSFASPPPTAGKRRRLRVLAASPDPRIRESAALARHAPPDLLDRLADDAETGVRACVARNPGAGVRTLVRLGTDDSAVVRGWVAANPATPPALAEVLAADPDPSVRAVVAWAAGWEQATTPGGGGSSGGRGDRVGVSGVRPGDEARSSSASDGSARRRRPS